MTPGSLAIHQAYLRGDVAAIRALLGDPPGFPNCRGPLWMGVVLEYAIYWSPLAAVRTLLDLGADPNYGDHGGFPSLIAALSTTRADRGEMVELLLAHGADIGQRGLNDWTPLHWAAVHDDAAMVELFLARGADPAARTRIDDYVTPLAEAERAGCAAAAAILRRHAGA